MNYKLDDEKKIIFLRQLALIYASDIFITDGLEVMEKSEEDSNLKTFYRALLDEMIMAIPLSQAISNTCHSFKYHEIKLIELGEESGKISLVLSDMADGLEKEKIISEKIKSSFRYPAVLSLLTVLILLIIVAIIVPVYYDLLLSSGAKISSFMSFLNRFGIFLRKNTIAILSSIVFFLALITFFKRTKKGTELMDKFSLRAFLSRRIRVKASSIVFTKNLAILLDSGIDFMKAFEILEEAESNDRVKGEIKRARDILSESSNFTEAIQSFTLFPNVLNEILSVSISTGHIVPSLKKAERMMLISLNKDIDKLVSMIEPAITVLISLIVATVLISGVLPVFNVLSDMI